MTTVRRGGGGPRVMSVFLHYCPPKHGLYRPLQARAGLCRLETAGLKPFFSLTGVFCLPLVFLKTEKLRIVSLVPLGGFSILFFSLHFRLGRRMQTCANCYAEKKVSGMQCQMFYLNRYELIKER